MMKINVTHLALLLLALASALGGPAHAKTPAKPAPAATPAADAPSAALDAPSPDAISTLRIFKSQGADVHYLGRMYGLDGWLVNRGKSVQVVYTTLDGQGTVVGVLYGPDGGILTTRQIETAQQNGMVIPGYEQPGTGTATAPAATVAPAAPASAQQGPASERLMHDVEASTYFKFGPDDAPILYVFADPRCHYCHDYWQALSTQFLPQNTVQVRIIPVGVLGEESVQQALRIISAPNPAEAWSKVEEGDVVSLAAITPAADAQQKLQSNNNLMVQWKMSGTPYSVYRSKDGKVKMIYAIPTDVAQVVADLGK